MSKMFYTMAETMGKLGRSEDEIRQLGREGRLREFRDGPRLMYKSDQVEAILSQQGGQPERDSPISLARESDDIPVSAAFDVVRHIDRLRWPARSTEDDITEEDKRLEQSRVKVSTAAMLTGYAAYEHELTLRKSWIKAVEEIFNDHPSVSEFSWRQYSQKNECGFWVDHNGVEIDGQCYDDVDKPDDREAFAAYKDAVELLLFFKMGELRSLFGNFVQVTVRRDGLVMLEVTEGV